MRTYKTAQIAAMVGVHPNTVRFYEEMGLLSEIPRTKSGYRVFNDRHLAQLRLVRTAFRVEIISDGLRQEAIDIVKMAARDNLIEAFQSAVMYLEHLREEKNRAEDAIRITHAIIENKEIKSNEYIYNGRREVAKVLGISSEVLRNWERNGLIQVPRHSNGHTKYSNNEINRLKIIKILRNAHYSMMSILRMLNHLDQGAVNLRKIINTPDEHEEIISAADRYITSLNSAEEDAQEMLDLLDTMRKNSDPVP